MTNWYLNHIKGLGYRMSKVDTKNESYKSFLDGPDWETIRDGVGSIRVEKGETINIQMGRSLKSDYIFIDNPSNNLVLWKGQKICLDDAKNYSGFYMKGKETKANDCFRKSKFTDNELIFQYDGPNATVNEKHPLKNDVRYFEYKLAIFTKRIPYQVTLIDPVITNDGTIPV